MQLIKQSEATAVRRTVLIGPLANTADDSAHTGTLSGADIRVSKGGAAEANSAGTATHIANGLYSYAFLASEVDTLGPISLRIAKTGVYGDIFVFQVAAIDPYDSTSFGLSRVDVAMSTRLAAADYEDSEALFSLADGVETSLTLRAALRLVVAAVAGRRIGVTTGTEIYRDYNNTKNRITHVDDGTGDTTSVTYDIT